MGDTMTAIDEIAAEPSAPVAPDWPTRCAALEADGISARKRVAALEAEVAKLREGLRPFEKAARGAYCQGADSVPLAGNPLCFGLTLGDLRRARALLQGQGGDE